MEIAGQDAELPEIRHRTRVFAALVLLVFCGLAGRLFYLQALRGESYHRLTSESLVRTVPLPALRGELRDRRGRVLATTRASYDVLVTPSQLERAAYDRLVRLLGPERDDLPSWERLREAARKAAKSGRELAVTFAPDISRDQMALIETTLESPGLRVVGAARREYPHGTLLAHTLGYLNEISAEELRERKDEGYAPGDQIGRTGLERQWESHLRGRNGFERAFARRNMVMSGEVKVSDVVDGPVRQEPVAGSHVVLSIDLDAQKILDRAIRSKPAAAAVLVDVETGRVLAIGSRPTFDPNVMSGRLTAEEQARILMDRNRPFLDKTLSETFNPGSTFKAISATAALEERLLTIDDRVRCGGFVRIGQRRFRCQKTHGSIGLHAAIIQSCNVFFYELGLRPGMMNRLAKFALDFGLGAPTGAGINGEQPGFVPTEEWHRAQKLRDPRNEGFVVGHALNTAIGEGATRVTVMQMALVYAAIANGGRLWLPQLVERVEGPGGEVVEQFPPRARRDLALSPETLATLRRALLGVTTDPRGTAFKARSRRFAIAGKTGTAQVWQGSRQPGGEPVARLDHAWFAGFAPANAPKVAFAVLVEHGGHGGDVAAPVATEMVDAFLDLPPSPTAAAPPPPQGAR